VPGAVGEALAKRAGRGTAREGSVGLGGAGDHRVTGAAGGSLGHRSDRDGDVLVEELVLAERRRGLRSLGGLLLGRVLAHAQGAQDLLLDLRGRVGVVLEALAGVLLALSQLVPLVGEPGTGLA